MSAIAGNVIMQEGDIDLEDMVLSGIINASGNIYSSTDIHALDDLIAGDDLFIGSNDAANFWIVAPKNNNRNIHLSSDTSGFGTGRRWTISADNINESGAASGSRFKISAFNNSGSYIDAPILINRGTGTEIDISRPFDMNNNIIKNIGNSGTDFDTNGGLTLADDLSADSNTRSSCAWQDCANEAGTTYSEICDDGKYMAGMNITSLVGVSSCSIYCCEL